MTVDDSSSIYVGGISYNASEETLRRAFHNYGPVVAVKIVNDQSVGGKCYGFVTFKNPRSALHAIDAMDGRTIEGRVVRVNQVKTRGGRSNLGRESFRQNNERGDRSRSRDRLHEMGAGGVRSRSRERLYERGGASGNRSRSQERVHGYNRDLPRDVQRERLQDRDQDRDRVLSREHTARDQREMGYVEREHDRTREQDWENNNKKDMAMDQPEVGYVERENNNKSQMETSRDLGRYQNNGSGTDERPNSVDGFSRDAHSDREFSSKSNEPKDQEEKQLEIATQKVQDLQQEITSMEEKAEEKKNVLIKLQEKVQTLKDAVTATRKLKSQRLMQLSELHKCYGQVKEYNEKLKNSEQDLQSLVNSTNLEDEL